MCAVEREYVRWFNRTRRRDGPLFRGRFRSRRVHEGHDLRNVVRYIDQNAVEARIAHDGGSYPYSLAWHYQRPSGPPWLTREVVEALVCDTCGRARYDPRLYDGVFGGRLTEELRWLVERPLRPYARRDLVSHDLVKYAPRAVREWMKRKAELADGMAPGLPILAPEPLLRAIDALQRTRPDWTVRLRRYRKPALPILRVGMLRVASRLSLTEIAARVTLPLTTVHVFAGYHEQLIVDDPDYSSAAAACLRRAASAEEQS